MASSTQPFSPSTGGGTSIAVNTSSSSTPFDPNNSSQVCVSNLGTDTVHVSFGGASKVSTSDDFVVFGGSQVVLSKDRAATHAALIAVSGTPTVHVIAGKGN